MSSTDTQMDMCAEIGMYNINVGPHKNWIEVVERIPDV